jgi:Zn-dependent M16 (insulinase) family peptidase
MALTFSTVSGHWSLMSASNQSELLRVALLAQTVAEREAAELEQAIADAEKSGLRLLESRLQRSDDVVPAGDSLPQ